MNDCLGKDDVPEDTKATMYAQQLQRVNQLKNQIFRPETSPVQMITHTEQTMTSELDTSSSIAYGGTKPKFPKIDFHDLAAYIWIQPGRRRIRQHRRS